MLTVAISALCLLVLTPAFSLRVAGGGWPVAFAMSKTAAELTEELTELHMEEAGLRWRHLCVIFGRLVETLNF